MNLPDSTNAGAWAPIPGGVFSRLMTWVRRWGGNPDGARAGGSQRVQATAPEAALNGRFEQLFENVGEGLLLCGRGGEILACNSEASRLCGQAFEALAGTNFFDVVRNSDMPGHGGPAARPGESLLRQASGVWLRVKLRETALRHDGVWQRLVHLEAVDEGQPDLGRVHELANFDSLTGLPNRALFRDRLAQAMNRARRSNIPLALMFLDLDRFKVVNDSLGHEVGDRLLLHVAQHLTQCLRQIDSVSRYGGDEKTTLSRLGGDEFTIIAEAITNAEHAGFVAQRLLEALSEPFFVGEEEIVMEASIGIAMYPSDDVDLDSLIRHADMAMYRSKSLGRGMFSFFSSDLNDAVSSRLSLERNLRRAIEREEFELHYQPKIDLGTGEVTGVEALLRWRCPSMGMVRPDHFISVLEDTGMIVPVGAWVIRKACAEMAHWDRLGLPPIRMAVNMSARQFRHQHLASLIEDTLCENEIDPGRLEIELTETLLMEDNEASRNMFANFTRIGVRLAIDDFGTGHSSLAYLKRFNIDTLKIDRSFVSALPDDLDDVAIASAVIAMGHSMHMRIVAEGVETARQADFLRRLGCDELQGYLLSRPLQGAELIDWLVQYEDNRIISRRVARSPSTNPISRLLSFDDTVPASPGD
jgi:predicted signal transduction protein with EAL and GGDEF domain